MDDPRTDSLQAQRLRDMAREQLDEAARCSNPAQRDMLLKQALGTLAEARRLRAALADAQNLPRAGHANLLSFRGTKQP